MIPRIPPNVLFLSTLLILISPLLCEFTYNTKTPPCGIVKNAYSSKGFKDDVPQHAIEGDHLRICQKGKTCCTQDMEHKLSTQSRAEFDKLLKDTIGVLEANLTSYIHKFDEYFKELMHITKLDFHDMFLKTYGLLYDENSYIFQEMFEDLDKYYLTGKVNLDEAMNYFFQRLYKRMFEKLNSQYTFTAKYLDCVGMLMDELKPFGDAPQKLTQDLRRSFIAVRTFVQSLIVGRDVIKNVLEVGPTTECSRALMKMTYCPHCQGLPDIRPCERYCINVMRGCLANHADLDKDWSAYVDGIINLSIRLESSFNIEGVVDPMDIKISEAIMNFQENGGAVSEKLYERCGHPRLRRSAGREDGEVVSETLKFSYQPSQVRPTTAAGTSLDRLVQNIKRKMKSWRAFWSKLADQLCDKVHPGLTHHDNKNCWAGNGKVAAYLANITGNGLANQRNNPEVKIDVSSQNSFINQQSLSLKIITNKLTHAFNGLEVDWPDDDEDKDAEGDLGSGSGGSGSGEGIVNTEDIYFSYSTPSHIQPTDTPQQGSGSLPQMGLTCLLAGLLLPFLICRVL